MSDPGERRVSARGTGLASSDDEFVGRHDELEQISALLISGSRRMITLVGPPGIGKTRLAAEVVRRVRDEMRGGVRVHWVRLARLSAESDYAAIERETAAAVIPADFSERSAWDALVDTLDQRDSDGNGQRVVLVFDNCEHVIDGVRSLIGELLEAITNLTVVATSLSQIGWVNEHMVNVLPLKKSEALTLFWQRAELVGRVSTGEAENDIAADICWHIHHFPLFIQLAAAQLRHRPLARIHAELTGRADDDKRMQWSRGPLAGAEERHRKVTDVIAWAYDMCTDEEQLLFERLAVLAAAGGSNPDDANTDVGAELDAIEAICADDEQELEGADRPALSGSEIEGILELLAGRSLVVVHITTTSVRYSLLESLRIFAWARLAERGPDEATRLVLRHLQFYRQEVNRAAAQWFGSSERVHLTWALGAWCNILTAIESSSSLPGQATAGLEIVAGVIKLRVPFVRGSIREIRERAERCLEASRALTPEPTELQMSVRATLAWLAVRQGLDAKGPIDDSMAAYMPGPDITAWRDHPEIDFGQPAMVDMAAGTEMFMSQRDPRAIGVLLRAREKYHDQGDDGGEVFAAMFAGLAAALLGSFEEADSISLDAVELVGTSGAEWAKSWAQLAVAVTCIKHGDPSEGADILVSTLTYQMSVGDQWGAHWSILLRTWALARLITGDGDDTDRDRHIATEIAHLAGGAQTLRGTLGVNIDTMGTFADETGKALEKARRTLGDAAFTAEFAQGRQLNPDTNEVYELALGQRRLDPVSQDPWEWLSPTEQRVAIHVAAGFSNPAIGRIFGRSHKTIDRHVSSILGKLEIPSREQVGRYIPNPVKPQISALIRQQIARETGSQRQVKR
ncbi:AAA family ATPase [Nocardia alni]|uniref:AAA family ATPase n=1 Tax=Nocardia alni TaxID=2815723 RepID=UPI001C2281D2|nr:AAA family ATPase [Nocardia alni]